MTTAECRETEDRRRSDEGRAQLGRPAIPHTQVHQQLRQFLETAQDAVVILLMALLLVIALEAIWQLGRMTFVQKASPGVLLSEVVYILILTELYRTLIYYLREHRVSVTLMVEVAIVSVLREQILSNAQVFDWQRILGSSLLLLVLGGLLAIERWAARMRNDSSEISAD